MGKRTIRIPRSKITAALETLPGKSVHVVMVDGKTHAGNVISADSTQVIVQDVNAAWTNKARHQQRLPINDIYYIIYDLISAW
jgi:hypothetical protein